MRLSWSDIRARAAAFSEKHREARYEKGETQTFYNDFFDVFGIDRRRVATFEHRVKNLPAGKQGFIDLFWPGTLIVEQKSANLDLKKASNQALDYYEWLAVGLRPRFILTCDFQRWHLLDLEEGREWQFKLHELKDRLEAFTFMLGMAPRLNRRQSEVNAKASQLMGQLHRLLEDSGYGGHDLQQFLVRLLFILFADDTRIFNDNGLFEDLLERRTAIDGSDLGRWLGDLFEVLNTPEDQRQTTLDEDLAGFPYINGDLFAERIRMPAFDLAMRTILIDASAFNWSKVSPAIFGGLFESVIDKVTRRRQGAHYTPEDAILKLIGPLFLDDLQAEFVRICASRTGRAETLSAFHDKLAALTFLDPACGAGNFLVVTYRELRELEREVIAERFLRPGMDRGNLKPSQLTRLKVDQFYGIEIDEFPARIAQVALWMSDHIANQRLGELFGENVPSIPLTKTPGIQQGDALEKEWGEVLPPERCNYVLGNPPFSGKKEQSAAQKKQIKQLFQNVSGAGEVDYVAGWYVKASKYIESNRKIQSAFVSTNSITQGEQVFSIWPRVLQRSNLKISFAHRTFEWKSDTPKRAHVHVVIVGMSDRSNRTPGRLFD